MKIHNKEFRIVEKTYGNGLKQYHAEYCYLNLFFFKLWKDYEYDYVDYGYGSISYKYRFKSYDDCLEVLTKNIEDKIKEKNNKKVINKSIFK